MKINNGKDNLSEILDKMLELQKNKKEISFVQKSIYIFGGLAGLIIVVFLCLMMYKNNFSIESLLSLLLAFFSIFISIFFYFKASDTSNNFYDKSYDIMKDVSVTLGKIEAQFGEKLSIMNEKLATLTHAEVEKKEELVMVEDDTQKIIDEFIAKEKIDKQEKEEFIKQLQEKQKESEMLKMQLSRLERERHRLDISNNENLDIPISTGQKGIIDTLESLPYELLKEVANGDLYAVSPQLYEKMRRRGVDMKSDYTLSHIRKMARNMLVHKCNTD